MAKSVITCGEKSGEIAKALNKAVSPSFKNSIKKLVVRMEVEVYQKK